MTRRGLTLLELLLAVALLGTVLVVAISWTRLVAHSGQALVAPAQWERDAHRVLALIADDLVARDLNATSRRAAAPVEIRVNDLVVVTRNALGERRGVVEHRYHRDASRGRLVLEERHPGGAGAVRPILEDVAGWSCRIDEETNHLEIVLRGGNVALTRRYRLP